MVDIETLLGRGVEEVIDRAHLEQSLNSGKKLRVKLGIDPTSPDLHLGHAVVLRKLRQFQDAGHQAVLIIGDFTATIGDPSGRAGAREALTAGQVEENKKRYLEQAGKILDLKSLEVRHNREWFGSMLLEQSEKLRAMFTIQQLTQREDFAKRLAENSPLFSHELDYPIMQAYDSVMIEADLELGGVDQKLNLITGRHLMEKMGLEAQDVLTVPLLEGVDGVKKMSKSVGNYIALETEPNDMFGKIMTVPDVLIDKYYNLLTDEERKTDDPREAKLELGRIIVDMYHGAGVGERAREEFVRVFSKKEKPEEMQELLIANRELPIVDLLLAAGVTSKSEARRLIEQGGVKINDEVKRDADEILDLKSGDILQIGKRKFFRLTK